MVFTGVDLDQIDKMAPRRVKSAPGPIELNQHFGAKTDLLDLECGLYFPFLVVKFITFLSLGGGVTFPSASKQTIFCVAFIPKRSE